jgi:electron transport complex, RnfABCDGE type, B subunit
MSTAIMVVVVMGAVGIVFGFILAVANKKFAMEVNPLIHEVEEVLPKGQCGACGFAGCANYAEAVVLNPDVAPNLCVPGKEAVAKLVAELTGKAAEKVEPRIAHVRCRGTGDKAVLSYNYKGVKDCKAASMVQGGPKGCKNGCVGFGNCVGVCNFGAMSMGENGLPVVDKKRCTGCGACETACPKSVIQMIPTNAKVKVDCNSKDKGAIARKLCTAACIGCGICAKNCSYGAIEVKNNLAVVDHKICMEKCSEVTCIAKCPTGAINLAIQGQTNGNTVDLKATV